MAVLTKYRTTTAAGVIAAVVLVLVFGSPPYSDWADDNATGANGFDWFLQLLAWPSWQFDDSLPVRDVLAAALRAILVVVFTAVFLTAFTGPRLSRTRSRGSQLLSGWSAYIFAAAAAGLLAALLHSDPSVLNMFLAAYAGAGYGLFTGWVVGAATFAAPGRFT